MYRGHLVSNAEHLTSALKIIMHSNYLHTKVHQQRSHLPMELDLDAVLPGDEEDNLPDPLHGTGMSSDDFVVGDMLRVWLARTWWHARLLYKSRDGTFAVRLVGARDRTTGVLPQHCATLR